MTRVNRWRLNPRGTRDSTVIFRYPKSPRFLTSDQSIALGERIAAGAAVQNEWFADEPEAGTRERLARNRAHRKSLPPNVMSYRVPREKAYLVAPLEGPTRFERVLKRLGSRVRETKDCYLLDGKPCNASDIMEVGTKLK